jgi:thioredoxin-related protein
MMKQFVFLPGLILLLLGCSKSANDAGALSETADEMDSTPFKLDEALSKAQAENKLVLLEFTGSDWCPPCKLLEKEVISTAEFTKFQNENLIFGKLDFPNRIPQSEEVKKNNATLAEKFEIDAFPTLVLLKHDGTELWRQPGYGGGGAQAIIAEIEKRKK